ncbi:hypothetical protein [Mucilaginibacter sp. HD30]
MNVFEKEYHGRIQCPQQWLPENIIEVDKNILREIVDKICGKDGCRYPLLALRILIHVITSIDQAGRVYISARQLSKSLDVNYDTVTKCMKYLRSINVLEQDKC